MTKTDVELFDNYHGDLVSISHKDIQNDVVNSDMNEITAIVDALLKALLTDLADLIRKQTKDKIHELGWRNKYRIHLLSKISQKRIYKEIGIIEKLIGCGLVDCRDSPTRWGKQKFQYRLNIASFLLTQEQIT